MSNLEINQLYNRQRLPENGFEYFCFLFYLPFGIVLIILRTLVALVVFLSGCILPNTQIVHNVIFKLICLSLGISVDVINPEEKENVEVYVSNQVSNFDHVAVHRVTGAIKPGIKLNPVLSAGFGVHYCGNLTNFDNFKKNISVLLSESKVPLYFSPESKITNGKTLLKFKSYPFSFSAKVQPICIKVSRPYIDIKISSLGSGFWSDVFFFMFSPYTRYKLQFLPPIKKNNLPDAEFAELARQSIANALKIPASEFSAADLLEWEKRYNVEQQRARIIQRPPIASVFTNNPELHRMALQVREVLPYVPYNAVYKDLTKTRSVDVTITNILEGQVYYIPETSGSSASLSTKTNTPQSSNVSSSIPSTSSSSKVLSQEQSTTAASSFGKSAQERTQSFQERKRQLIENAKKRYIEKHGLNIITNNC